MKKRTTSHHIARLITTITLAVLGIFGIIINIVVFSSRYKTTDDRDQVLIQNYYNNTEIIQEEMKNIEQVAMLFPLQSITSYTPTRLPHLYTKKESGYQEYYIITINQDTYYAQRVTDGVMLQKTLIISLIILLAIVGAALYFISRYASKHALHDIQTISNHIKNTTTDTLEIPLHIDHLSSQDELQPIIQGLNQTNKTLAHQIRVIKQFVSGVSHEFRTPLAILQAKIQLAKIKNDPTVILNDIETQGKTMQKLLDTLLLLTRIEHDDIETTHINLATLTHDINHTYANLHKTKHIISSIHGEKDIKSHPGMVGLILTNLIENAYKYTNYQGNIIINIDHSSRSIHNPNDTITPKTIKHMFDPFRQADVSKQTQGFGLGLALVHQAVSTLGRSIQASTPSTGGCLITIYFEST